jgi:hypothetical protein
MRSPRTDPADVMAYIEQARRDGCATLHWPNYGDDPLPTPAEALAAPLSAFPNWFLRMECVRCGQERFTNATHMAAIWQSASVRWVVARMSHEGCGGLKRPGTKVVFVAREEYAAGGRSRRVPADAIQS